MGYRDHVGEESYDCGWEGCCEVYCQQSDLVSHVNRCHVTPHVRGELSMEADYICLWQDCPRQKQSFKRRYKLMTHIRTHTHEKPHCCSICGQTFNLHENLKIHKRSHTGEKPYACPYKDCSKTYSNTGDRAKHVRTHLARKPYRCKQPGCDKSYTDPGSLRKHIRTQGHQPLYMSLYTEEVVSANPLPERDYSLEELASNPLLSSASVHFHSVAMDSISMETSSDAIETCGEVTLSSDD